MRVVVTHLGLTPQERRIQVGRLVESLSDGADGDGTSADGDVSATQPPPTVILGDFNLVRRQTRASRLLEEHFPTFVSEPTYPSRNPQLALDRIYLSHHWVVETSHVVHTGVARIASDHLPLVAGIRLVTRGGVAAMVPETAAKA